MKKLVSIWRWCQVRKPPGLGAKKWNDTKLGERHPGFTSHERLPLGDWRVRRYVLIFTIWRVIVRILRRDQMANLF